MPTIARVHGGPAVSVRRLVESLRVHGSVEAVVFAGLADGWDFDPAWGLLKPRISSIVGPRRLGWTPGLTSQLIGYRPDVIFLNGLWQYHALAAYRASRHLGVPMVISPRGALEPWALRNGRLQKSLANNLFQRWMLQSAAAIVVTSQMEADGVRAAGYRAPIGIIPNGIDVAAVRSRVASTKRTALFLSRVSPKKGILDLLEAWAELRPADWLLKIVGPSERGFGEVVVKRISDLGLGDSIMYLGPLWGERQAEAYASSDLFVLPSYSENFGMVVGEALAAGVPVVTTQATPWESLVIHGCGWWIPVGKDALKTALADALARSVSELARMGRNGRALIERQFSWQQRAEAMASLLTWVKDPSTGTEGFYLDIAGNQGLE
jgi:glycosyltransferase involved in cell wall biosynthesis